MSVYLTGADLETYGVPGVTPAQILQASALVDAYLKRPEGIAFSTDYLGQPCYMAGLQPQQIFTLSSPVSPGVNVPATITGGMIGNDLIGEVLIADRATTANTEALVVTGIGTPGSGQVTIGNVTKAHASGVLLETGLTLVEERPMPSKRNVTRVSKFPLVRVISGIGRYAYGRRSDQVAGLYNDTNLLAALQTFGGPPAWVPFDISQVSISATTGEVWVPAGLMLAYYSDVRLGFVAGFSSANLPPAIKSAVAAICTALATYPEMSGNMKKLQAGDTAMERFANTMIDADIKQMIDQYRAKLLF